MGGLGKRYIDIGESGSRKRKDPHLFKGRHLAVNRVKPSQDAPPSIALEDNMRQLFVILALALLIREAFDNTDA